MSIFFSYPTFSQDSLDAKLSKSVCICLDSVKALEDFTEDIFGECLQKNTQSFYNLLMEACMLKYGDTTKENSERFGVELMERISNNMVHNCDAYFIFIDSFRYKHYDNLNKDSLKKQLAVLNNTKDLEKDKYFYSNRISSFFHLKMYDSALKDIEIVLKEDISNIQALTTKAWINEIRGDYSQAITLYEKAAQLSNNKGLYTLIEVVKRKRKNNPTL